MKNEVLSRIDDKYNEFSKTYKLISDYIKYNFTEVSFYSLKELSSKTGVSTASVSRYAQALGYNGYQDFQKGIQRVIKNEIEPSTEVKNSLIHDYNDVLLDLINLNIKNLEDTYTEDLYIALNEAVDMISYDNKLYIVGLRSTFTIAYHLYYILSQYLPNVELIDMHNDISYDKLAFTNKDDVLISISFSKYSKSSLKITEFFKKQGNKVIGLTDSVFSPIASYSDICLIVPNRHNTFSFVSVMTVSNALAISIGKKFKKRSFERVKRKREILKENDVHVIK